MEPPEHHCPTAHVRPIADVIAELRPKLTAKLPGSPAVAASWSVLNECAGTIEMALSILADDDLPVHSRWIAHGEMRVASTAIRKVADAFKVPVMTCQQR